MMAKVRRRETGSFMLSMAGMETGGGG